MLCSSYKIIITITKEGRRKLLEVTDVYGVDYGDSCTDVYLSSSSSSCIH